MRTLLAATLCGMMMHAPALAQDAEPSPSAPAATDEAQPQEHDAVSSGATESEPAGKPDGASPSSATIGPVAGYTYFHRAGASLEDQRADLDACRPVVLAMNYFLPDTAVQSGSGTPATPLYMPYNPSVSPGAELGAGLVLMIGAAAAMAAQQRALELRSMQLNYENCMLVRGWSVMVLDNESGAGLDRLSRAQLTSQLDSMVGAAAPLGSIGRAFDNAHQFRPASEVDEMSLSLRLLPDSYLAREVPRGNNMLNAVNRREERDRALRARERAQREAERQRAAEAAYVGGFDGAASSVDIASMPEPPEGSALVLIESAGPSPRFVRTNVREGDGFDHIGLHQFNTVLAFAVPAGDWRLVSLSTDTPATSHCLGAPMFRVEPGQVVFAGAFDADGGVSLGLDDARAALAAQPHLAERLQAASYVNGSTFECGSAWFATAYEIADAPFVEGYAGGSRAGAPASE